MGLSSQACRSIKTSFTIANGEESHKQGVGVVLFQIDDQTIGMTVLSISALNGNGLSVLSSEVKVEIPRSEITVARRISKGKM